ncbi:MAG: RNA methyltransferase [Firmicutes bacterium]|nr:RNA methyltransferase [Bacillota bacterium]
MEVISGTHNKLLKLYKSLRTKKWRDRLGLVPLEGRRLVAEVLQRGIRPEFLLLAAGKEEEILSQLPVLPAGVPLYAVEARLFARTAFTESPQDIMAVVKKPVWTEKALFPQEPALLLVADRIQDPGNLGTMLRSAAAAGAGGAILLPGTVDPSNPKALRSSMGAFFALPVVEMTFAGLQAFLTKQKIALAVAGVGSGLMYDEFDWRKPVAVVIGNEGSGVSPEVAGAAEATVSIPMACEIESLNAAVAMSVLFFEAARQRRRR